MSGYKHNYVVGFMFDPSEQVVLLIEKSKPEWQKGLYNGVGGKIEIGESPDAAMIREFEEETGVFHTPWIQFVRVADPGKDWVVYFYRARSSMVYNAKTTTEEKVSLFDVSHLPQGKLTNLTWLIPMALDPNIRTDIISNEET